jgi:hypothetical protein
MNTSHQNGNHINEGRFQIYCDLDGVLVDFDQGVRDLCNGRGPNSMTQKEMWSAITSDGSFFKNLPWTRDGRELWEAIHRLSPDILTGVPMVAQSRSDKFLWCIRELFNVEMIQHVDMAGLQSSHAHPKGLRVTRKRRNVGDCIAVDVITCWSRNKHYESRPGAILIDDRGDLAADWEARGGIFIHHISTANTLTALRRLNIIP